METEDGVLAVGGVCFARLAGWVELLLLVAEVALGDKLVIEFVADVELDDPC